VAKRIALGNGLSTLVDDEDYPRLVTIQWYHHRGRGGRTYAISSKSSKLTYMHVALVGPVRRGLEVDHINGDSLDNRRINLRVATHQQNCWNMVARAGASSFKGVTYDPGRGGPDKPWRARICRDGQRRHVGRFASEADAARAYDRAATALFGSFARLNFTTAQRPT